MEYIKFLEDNNVDYDAKENDWHLKNERDMIRLKNGNSYDTSYCAWKHFKGSFRIWMIELHSLTDSELSSITKGIIPDSIKSEKTHCICVYMDTSWRGLHNNNTYIWWEYSWKAHRGVHKYKSLDDLVNDVILKWKTIKHADCTKLLMTKITNTKIGCTLNEFIDRGMRSKIITVSDI